MKINYAKAYAALLKLYQEIPYRFFRGYSFPPLHYLLGLTYDCNIDCTFCFEGRKDRLNQEELNLGEIKKIIDQVPFYGLMTYLGGEPFMHRDIHEIIDYSAKKCKFSIVTNGLYNVGKNARLIVEKGIKTPFHNGIVEIAVSLIGLESLHDQVVQMKSAYKKAVEGLKRIRKLRDEAKKRFPLISIRVTLLEENVTQLNQLVEVSKEVGADICMFTVLNMQGNIYDPFPIAEYPTRFYKPPKVPPYIPEEILRREFELIREAQNGSDLLIKYNPIGITEDAIVNYYSSKPSLKNFSCRQPWQKLMIQPNGDPMPCVLVKEGNLKTDTVSDIWNRKVVQDFRRVLKQKEVFPVCFGCCALTYNPGENSSSMKNLSQEQKSKSESIPDIISQS